MASSSGGQEAQRRRRAWRAEGDLIQRRYQPSTLKVASDTEISRRVELGRWAMPHKIQPNITLVFCRSYHIPYQAYRASKTREKSVGILSRPQIYEITIAKFDPL
eukprot:2152488-Prymnesium_polylepis.1